jgi:hypothetical protein
MPLEEVRHRLVAHDVPQIAHGTDDSPVAPAAILPGHLQHPLFDHLYRRCAPRRRSNLRSVELPRNELAVPTKDGLGSNDLSHLRQSLPAEAPANFGQTDSLRVRETRSPVDLVPENPIFRHQVFVPKEELLVHRAGDVRQHSLPIHRAESTQATASAQPPGRPVNP